MAIPNMLVTLVANTTGFTKGLRTAATESQQFSRFAGASFAAVGTALGGLGVAFLNAIPDIVKLGVESRKADLRLEYMAINMTKLGQSAPRTVAHLKKFADLMQKKTGIDDEEIKSVQAMLLMYPKLAKTADKLGGTFDRVTTSAFDLAVLGFGDAADNAKKLAKLMDEPIKKIDSMSRAGIIFTEAEKQKAKAIADTNGKMAAADYLLSVIEGRTKGIAEKTANPLDILRVKFEEIGETIALRMIPRIDDLAVKIGAWLDGPYGKKAIDTISQAFTDFVNWIGNPANTNKLMKVADAMIRMSEATLAVFDAIDKFTGIPKWLVELMFGKSFNTAFQNSMGMNNNSYVPNVGTPGSTGGPGVVADRRGAPVTARGITVNVTGLTPSATIGATVIDAVKTAQRLGVR